MLPKIFQNVAKTDLIDIENLCPWCSLQKLIHRGAQNLIYIHSKPDNRNREGA